MPPEASPEEERLAWFVREAWPSLTSGTAFTEGTLPAGPSPPLMAAGLREPALRLGAVLEDGALDGGGAEQVRVCQD